MLYLDYILLIIGLIINIKTYYWITISRKGFKSETPEGFLRYPNLYASIDIIFFVIIILFTAITWYLVAIIYFLSFIPSGILAEKKFSEIVKELEEKKDNNLTI